MDRWDDASRLSWLPLYHISQPIYVDTYFPDRPFEAELWSAVEYFAAAKHMTVPAGWELCLSCICTFSICACLVNQWITILWCCFLVTFSSTLPLVRFNTLMVIPLCFWANRGFGSTWLEAPEAWLATLDPMGSGWGDGPMGLVARHQRHSRWCLQLWVNINTLDLYAVCAGHIHWIYRCFHVTSLKLWVKPWKYIQIMKTRKHENTKSPRCWSWGFFWCVKTRVIGREKPPIGHENRVKNVKVSWGKISHHENAKMRKSRNNKGE